MDRFETLLTAYLEGSLDTDDSHELAELVRGQLALRKRFLFQTELHGLLWSLFIRPERQAALVDRTLMCLPGTVDCEKTVDDVMQILNVLPAEKPPSKPRIDPLAAPRRARWYIHPVWVAVALVLFVCAPVLWVATRMWGPFEAQSLAAIARMGTFNGNTTVLAPVSESGEQARLGMPLLAMKGVQTDGSASFTFNDGTTVSLAALPTSTPARIWLRNTQPYAVSHRNTARGKRLSIDAGKVTFDVVRQPDGETFIITTPHAEVEVVGTVLTVQVLTDRTEVSVQSGVVKVTRTEDKRGVRVSAGQSATTSTADLKPEKKPE